jgi:hypothetical protein
MGKVSGHDPRKACDVRVTHSGKYQTPARDLFDHC